MKKITIKSCPLCGSETLEPVLTCVDSYASGEAFALCSCRACGFVLTQDAPVEEEMGRYYDVPDYISHTDTRRGLMNRVYHWARCLMLYRKARLLEHEAHRCTGRLLDIGAGTGYFAATMQRRGWQVEAVERSEKARRFALERFGLEVKADGRLAEMADGAFDVITLWHVMEHLEHLHETWQALHRLLDNRGILVVAVPNRSSADAQRYGAYWAAYDVPRHLWHFTPETMQRLGAAHGFILASRHPMPLDGFYVSMLSEQHMRRRFPFVRGLVVGTWCWVRSLVKKDRSSSIIYVFRKKNNHGGNPE